MQNRFSNGSLRYPSPPKRGTTPNMTKGQVGNPPGQVNLKMLAEHLELSQTTVSLVLNESPSAKSIPQDTRNRVIEAARRLNYRPNYFARSLRQRRSMSVGVLAPDLSEGYFTRVMTGVVEELNESHYFYFTACHYWNQELMEKYPRMLVDRAVDGFLLLNTSTEPISSVPVPVVAISSAYRSPEDVTNVFWITISPPTGAETSLRFGTPADAYHARSPRDSRLGIPLGEHSGSCAGDGYQDDPNLVVASTQAAGR